VVRCGREIRCAKVYKEAHKRSFKQAAEYQEGRKIRGSRDARAMSKRTRHGQKEAESAWLNAEVQALYKLSSAGVRVPKPYLFMEGVLLMELVQDENGRPAPSLHEVAFSSEQAVAYHAQMLRAVVRMLCAGLVHGDLSEFNVLVDAHGPVIIDLPQAVNAASNNHASRMLERDVRNMTNYFGKYAPELLKTHFGKEIWQRYVSGTLTPDTELSGQFMQDDKPVDLQDLMDVIDHVLEEERLGSSY
jgi:RIO kinase 1